MVTVDDRRDLLRALQHIGEAEGVVDFAMRTCQEVLRLVPGVSVSYNEVNTAVPRASGIVHPDPGREWFEQYGGFFEQHVLENPLVQYFEATGEGDVVSWTDLDPDGHFRQTPLYREFYVPNGIFSQAAFLLPAPPGIYVGIAINRDGTEFDVRERALLNELRVHLVNLYRLVTHVEASRQREAALADDGWSVVVVDNLGAVLASNDLAVAIGERAGVDLSVGASLADGPLWSDASVDLWARSRPAAPAKVGSHDTPFEARLLRSGLGPHLLWIREPSRVTAEDAVALGLSPRQADVAVLLSDGLTNDQIGKRLGLATGTVRAHLDAIFDRLGVRSRAAVVAALRARYGA